MVTTDGHLMGGRVIYRQPASGFRSGVEPVLLAASVSARSGEHVLEAGTGAGAALLCLHVRIPGIRTTGVEADTAAAELAAANAELNRFTDLHVVADRIETAALPHLFDHAIANPPYHRDSGCRSPEPTKEIAKRGSDVLIRTWINRLSRLLRNRGSLTLIVPAGRVPCCLASMADAKCPCTVVFPLWPKPNRLAKLVLLRGIRNGRMPMTLHPGLVLHDADGSFSAVAQGILSGAAALSLTG